MQEEWYVSREGERLGPYQWEQLVNFAKMGQLLPTDQVWHPGNQQWFPAGGLPGLFKVQEQPTGHAENTGAPPPRKKRGCLGCLLFLLIAAVIFAGGIALLFYFLGNLPSKNIVFGKGVAAVRDSIGPNGGTVVVERPGDPLHGFTIEIPEGAYEKKTGFKVSYHPIKEHKLGPYFDPVTPLINVDNGGRYSDETLEVTIPVPLDPGRFTMAFYYDRKSGKLEGLPLLDAGDGYITVATRHFSDIVGTSISIDELQGRLDIDTGFRPGYDDWQFTNYGSWLAPRGHCAGQAISAMWYYYERRLRGERPLYGRYDNNDRGYGTIDFWQDDSWGYRLASAVQDDMEWDRFTRRMLLKFRDENDMLTLLAFAYAMLLTGEPQYVGIASTTSPGGHAIIAYRIEQDKIYVADPNYPGQERVINYRDGRFRPYNSGDNATSIAAGNEISYDKIGYFAKSALIDWEQVGRRWAELDRGAVAEDLFPRYDLEVLIADDDDQRWFPMTDNFVTSTEETGRVVQGNVDMTGKLAFRARPSFSNVNFYAYRGTDFLARNNTSQTPMFLLDLDDGVNDLGFWVWEEHDNRVHYVDFQRYLVIYNQEDITGDWQGVVVVEEAEKVLRFIENIFVTILGPVFGHDKVRDAFRDAVTTPGIGRELPMAFRIDEYNEQSGEFRIAIAMVADDGSVHEDITRGRYRQGVLTFSMRHPDGTTLTYEGRLTGQDRIYGTFTSVAWGFIRDAMSGYWQAEKQ